MQPVQDALIILAFFKKNYVSCTVYVEVPRGKKKKKKNSSKTRSGLFACIKIRVKWVACVLGRGGAGGWNTLRQSKWFVDLKRLKHTQAGLLDGFQLTCHI